MNANSSELDQSEAIIVVIGDVHSRIRLAAAALGELEQDLGRRIDQVLSVGDLCLMLEEGDWRHMSGPKKHRHPERSPEIRKAWAEWRWPLAMIGGNHEAYHRLRASGAASYGHWLNYVDAGRLPTRVEGLRVAGLSGIYHPDHLHWPAEVDSWPRWSEEVVAGRASRRRLTYFSQGDLDSLLAVDGVDVLLTHDWPLQPPGTQPVHAEGSSRDRVGKTVEGW